MARLLMIEGWIGSTGRALPPLLRELGHEYVLLTRDAGQYPPDAAGTPHPVVAHASEIHEVETNDVARAVAAATAVARRHPVDGVLTTCDYYLITVAEVARALGLPGEDPAALATARRKDAVRAALAASGVPDVPHAVVAEPEAALKAAADLGWPLIAKPVDGNASVGVRLVTDETSLLSALHEVSGRRRNSRGQACAGLMLLEQVIEGPEVSVESVTVQGRTHVLAVTDKSLTGRPSFVESGHMVPARLADGVRRAVEAHVHDVVDAVGLRHGLAHTEVRITTDGPRLIELNPRQGGNSIFELLDRARGLHPLRLLVDLALGEVPVLPGSALPGSAAIVFVISPEPVEIVAVEGGPGLDSDPAVVRWHVDVPATARPASDNACYLGEVVALGAAPGTGGASARFRAEAAVQRLRLVTRDGRHLRPLGFPSGLC